MTERTISQMVDEQLNKLERGPMPERTLTQITNEIEQAAKRVTAARTSEKNAQDDLRKLLEERNKLEASLLPATTSYRSRGTRPAATTEEPSTKDLRAWAADTGWTYQGEPLSKWKNRLPNDVKKALLGAYNATH